MNTVTANAETLHRNMTQTKNQCNILQQRLATIVSELHKGRVDKPEPSDM